MKRFGFSLAEALITLLIISITTAALAPTITTRRNAALNPNLFWSNAHGGVFASGSASGTKFLIGSTAVGDAALTIGKGTFPNALSSSGIITSSADIITTTDMQGKNLTASEKVKGATVTDGTVSINGGNITGAKNLTVSEEVKGATLTSTSKISAKDIEATGSINQLSGGVFLTTDSCPSSKWTKNTSAIQVCTSADCASKISLYKCTYNGGS